MTAAATSATEDTGIKTDIALENLFRVSVAPLYQNGVPEAKKIQGVNNFVQSFNLPIETVARILNEFIPPKTVDPSIH